MLPLILHVLPPAFHLPSISPDCIIAIACLRYTQQYDSWIVIADAAEYPHLVPPFLIPAYNDREIAPQAIEGLDAILHHLDATNNGTAQLSTSLSISEKAQVLALSSHLRTRLEPLVALSLYANSENYVSATRPGFASALSLPESWILPHQSHKSAMASCAHLGIEPEDLDLLIASTTTRKQGGVADAGPVTSDNASTNDPNKKPDSSVAAKVKIQRRIDDLVYAALGHFVAVLGPPKNDSVSSMPQKTENTARWLFGASHPTLADLIALSLLSLAVLPYSSSSTDTSTKEPALANPFLLSSINRQYPRLIPGYLLPGLEDAFAGRTLLEDALYSAQPATTATENDEEEDDSTIEDYDNMNIGNGQISIPWRSKQNTDGWRGVRRAGNAFGAVLAEAIGIR